MSLTTTVRNRLIDGINTAFDAIGTDTATKMPKSKTRDNRATTAYEYFVSNHLVSRARARFELAKKMAIGAGVIFDHEKNPRNAGTNEPVYNGEHVSVWLTVNNPTTAVKADKMAEYLLGRGVDAKLVADAYEYASTTSRPPHVFRVSLVAAEPSGK